MGRDVSPCYYRSRVINLIFRFPVPVLQTGSHMLSLHSSTLTQYHPECPLFLHDLATTRFECYGLSGQQEELDKRILRLSEDISLPIAGSGSNTVQTHWDLTLALHRSMKPVDPEDVNATIKRLLNLSQHPHEVFEASHQAVTTSLIGMLAARVKGEAQNALEDIDEIVVFCRELLTLDTPRGHLNSAFGALTRMVLDDKFSRGKQSACLDQAIRCVKDALNACPPLSLELANLLVVRFLTLNIDDDYQEAKAVLQDITHPHPPSHRAPPEPYQIQASALTAALEVARSIVYSKLKDWEGAASRCHSFLQHCTLFGDPLHPVITELLASHAEQASEHFGTLQRTAAAHSEVDHLPFSTQLGTCGNGANGSDIVAASPMALEERIDGLRDLYSMARPGTEFSWTRDTTLVDEAIKYNRGLLATSHHIDQPKFLHLSAFGDFLYVAFDNTKKVEYLDESIVLHREILGLKDAQLTQFSIIQRLIWSLSTRWRLFHCKSDFEETMDLYASGVRSPIATTPSRFELACRWAHAARLYKHHSLVYAYKNAMSLMQSSLVCATLQDRLDENSDLYRTPLNFASYQTRVCQLEGAIETLEQGRVLLWSEMRGLRTSTDRLRAADPAIAEKFSVISQQLEVLTTSALNWSLGSDNGDFESERMGQLSGLMERQHGLLKERDALISMIRGLSGSENFLLPVSFDTLRSAASHGPVIIINHCKWRSDILIVLHGSPPSLIPTTYDFFDRANYLKDKLLSAREIYGLDSEHYENALSSVLVGLYELVGRPVIERLRKLGIAEQSRVWWCPTSVFGYLPLHAMGPIPSDGGDPCYFSDVYVSSYTPTLSALIASRERDTQTSALPTLRVAQHNPSPPGAWPDVETYDLDLQATSLGPGNMSSSTVLNFSDVHVFSYTLTLSALLPS